MVAQWDGIGVAWESWRSGDALIQVHDIDWPDEASLGPYQIIIGLYESKSGDRWRTELGSADYEIGLVERP